MCPNWSYNTLSVCGNENELIRFKEQAYHKDVDGESTDLSLNNFIPMPEEYIENEMWYPWRIDNWGCKWDVVARCEGIIISKGVGKIVFEFNSAYCPPVAWLTTVSKQYPELKFKLDYSEPLNDFEGIITARNGVLSHKNSSSNHIQNVFESLDDFHIPRALLD